ncbi:potassium uptake protein, TrkA family [Mycoplasma haemofelis str. Langford 1]|uniref:Potassium uptake protein TrkA n=2 Tax=Mycoplasma haemofelis TaxID=29501 RepID=F6FFH4_MYCHI|nr:TrkA family potassium uptake protein [Mycoplasma haemofelis]AEG72369.1 potassium uptake protein TrkA [Mycoplasma haemofelis Ohio2]CBY92055.1 potassium uptake protein, TrkA family [Mycoplasma haemofelis str. Langford 1]
MSTTNSLFNFKSGKPYKEYCLIGLNKFNYEIGLILLKEGHKVTVLEKDPKIINEYGKDFDHVISCDCTNINELAEIGVEYFDYVILGITSMRESVIIATNLKELRVGNILCKAKDSMHRKILNALGIKIAFVLEEEVAVKVAYKAMYDLNVELFSFDKDNMDTFVIRLPVLNKTLWARKINEIAALKTLSATIVSIKKRDGEIKVPVNGENMIDVGDLLCLICKKEDISKVKDLFSKNPKY